MIKVGLIGLGKMGMSHCALLNAHPNVDLVGAADTSKLLRWGLDKYSSIPVYADYQQMIENCEVDAVVIATPTKTHYPLAKACLNKSLHVFLEKPCCLSYLETCSLKDIAEEKKMNVQIGYHNRFIGTFNEAKRLVGNGEIGKVYNFKAEAYGPVVIREKESSWRSTRSEGGGCLYDYSSHVINLVSYILGEIESVSGTRLEYVFSKDAEDAVYSTLQLTDGASGQLSVSWSEESYRKMTTSLTISGSLGRIEVNSQELKLYRNSNEPDKEKRGWSSSYLTDHTDPVNFYLRGEEYSAQLDAFIDNISNGILDGINSIYTAAETDRVIELLIADNGDQGELLKAAISKSEENSSLLLVDRIKRVFNPAKV